MSDPLDLLEEMILEIIRKVKIDGETKYAVYTKNIPKGKKERRRLGVHDSLAAAKRQLAAIEISKARRG
jgi:hypothetical protein